MQVHSTKRTCGRLILVGVAVLFAACSGADAQQAPAAGEPLGQLIDDYVKAWNARDFDALGRLWTEDGELINAQGVAVDRKALLATKAASAEGGKSVLSVKVEPPRMLDPNVALVEGESSLATPDGEVFDETRFSGILVKRNGKWQIRLIRELSSERPAPAEPLKDLAWMIGDWVGIGPGIQVRISSEWDMGHRYLVSRFEVEPESGDAYDATQRIGWDPATRSIKSWYFDSRGSVSTGAWEKRGDHWFVTITGTQFDGASMSGTSAVTPVDGDSYLRTLVNTRIGRHLVPDQELHLFRVNSQTAE